MKKVLIPLLVLSVLCLAVVPIFSSSTTASADESSVLSTFQFGYFSFPAPSVITNYVWNSSLQDFDLNTNDLVMTLSGGTESGSSGTVSILSYGRLNYGMRLDFPSSSRYYRWSIFNSDTQSYGQSMTLSGHNASTIYYLITQSASSWFAIDDGSRISYIEPVALNVISRANVSLENPYGLNQYNYNDWSDVPISFNSYYVIPIVASLYDFSHSFTIYNSSTTDHAFSFVMFYQHNPDTYQYAYDKGFYDGSQEGYSQGKQEGISIGDQQGYDRGFEEGKERGYQEGLVADEPLSAFQALLVGANQALQTPLFGEGSGAFSIMDFVVIALGLGLLFWFLKMFAGG